MKYRIVSFYLKRGKRPSKGLKAKRRNSLSLTVLPPLVQDNSSREYINFNTLFELGALPEGKMRRQKRKKFAAVFKNGKGKVCRFGKIVARKIKLYSEKNAQKPRRLAFLSGVLVASLTVTLICVGGVLGKLFFPYMRSYTAVAVPHLVGEDIETAETAAADFELRISYENSTEVAAGKIISQRPEAGVIRKIFKNGDPCIITLTVSRGRDYYTVEGFKGSDSRTALLSLYNAGVSVKQELVYSDTVPEGIVIGSIPSSGATLYDGEILTLQISLGKQIITVSTPDLYGLGEAQATALLEERGLKAGKISYAVSSTPAGKIIRQQYSPYEKIPVGSTVDFTVSLGQAAEQKTVPDLYGLTVEEAKNKLYEVGLVLGGIFSVSSGAPQGTVVTQTPAAGTPITSSITSVDIFISS